MQQPGCQLLRYFLWLDPAIPPRCEISNRILSDCLSPPFPFCLPPSLPPSLFTFLPPSASPSLLLFCFLLPAHTHNRTHRPPLSCLYLAHKQACDILETSSKVKDRSQINTVSGSSPNPKLKTWNAVQGISMLIELIHQPHHVYLINVDPKSPAALHDVARHICHQYPDNVYVLDPPGEATWGAFSMVLLELRGMAALLAVDRWCAQNSKQTIQSTMRCQGSCNTNDLAPSPEFCTWRPSRCSAAAPPPLPKCADV